MLVFTGHDPRWAKQGACGNTLQQSQICMTKRPLKLILRDFLASDCRQQMFDHDSCEFRSAGSSLPLPSIFDRLALYIEWIRKLCSLKVSSNLLKNKDFCVFSSMTWNRYNVISFNISLQKQNSRSRTATTNFKTETQTCGNRTTPCLLRDLLIKLLVTTSWQQLIKDN